jgi:hypothetical protein
MFNTEETLRTAGLIAGPVSPAVSAVYGSLSKEETDLLISLVTRLKAAAQEPEVVAHSQEWSSPEASQSDGIDAITMCGCGLWSGSGLVDE